MLKKIADELNEFIARTLEATSTRIQQNREGADANTDALVLRTAARIVRENRHMRLLPDAKKEI